MGAPSEKFRLYLLQFFYFFAGGSALPFLTLYLKEVLLYPDGSPAYSLIGGLFLVSGLAGLVASPAAGYIADTFHAENRLLSISGLMYALGSFLYMVLWFLPPSYYGLAYALVIAGSVLRGIFMRPIIPLLDAQILAYFHHAEGNARNYGTIRWMGSFAWAFSLVASGILLQLTGKLVYPIAVHVTGLLLFAFIALPPSGTPRTSEPTRWEHLLKDRLFFGYLSVIFLVGFSVMGSYSFTTYLMEESEVSYLLMGLSFAVASLPEIPLMYLGRRLLARWGMSSLFLMGVGLHALKLVLFLLIPQGSSALLFVLVQILHGCGYAFYYLGHISIVDGLSHHTLRATYQNLQQFAWGLGASIGGLAGGIIIEHTSVRVFFGVDAAILVLAMGIFSSFILPALHRRALRETS
ncbi:MFS transporter [Spirochaeta thermophila]|uniref:Predicted major facilitator superfamily MFS-1 n=1 Tax=Winmispira thermophila (strain ATCC 49972 / DSM 6192 / RI 19.B1) TaxID=665571 RepID=E0RNS4_WINT6|nr:MFS transporter [Spirochaeta thermophila]ADN01197.1 predicted major facilitator superfamily MFS-1 [Spirochaeta thermophila DSM 6192]